RASHRSGPAYRKADDEVRALAVAAADGDAATEQLDELLGDAEAEPRAAVPRRRLRVDLLEVGGQRRHVRLPDADPAVPDEDEDAARAGRPPAVPCLVDEGKAREGLDAAHTRLDAYAAMLGELDPIGDQVAEYLLHLLAVGGESRQA